MTTTFWREGAEVQRHCHDCGAPWTIGQGACTCGSTTFDERVEPPKDAEKPEPHPAVRGWS